MSRQFFLPAFFLLALLPALFSQSKFERQLEALERQRFEAMTKKDLPFLQTVLSDDLTYCHSNGLQETKTEHLKNIETGALVYKSMQPETIRVRRFGKTAMLDGIVQVKGVLKDKEFSLRLRYLDVYVKQKGRWQLAAWQSLRLE
ncbi:MAG: nuclear transport factor 2 family protein [Bacteroidota bacterium]